VKTSTVVIVVLLAGAAAGGYYLYKKRQAAPQQSSGGLFGQVSDLLHTASSVISDWREPSSGSQQDPSRVARPYTTTLG